jgi:hypothetical protein
MDFCFPYPPTSVDFSWTTRRYISLDRTLHFPSCSHNHKTHFNYKVTTLHCTELNGTCSDWCHSAGHKSFFSSTQNIRRHNHKSGKRTLFWATSYLHRLQKFTKSYWLSARFVLFSDTFSFSMACMFTVKHKLDWMRQWFNFMYVLHIFLTDTDENHLSHNSQYLRRDSSPGSHETKQGVTTTTLSLYV